VIVEMVAPTAYTVTLSAAEREQLLVALEFAVATKRGEPERGVLIVDVDADRLDALADQLFLAGGAS
jgi:hypothetical protein